MSASSFPFRRHALALALALATGNAHAAMINVSDDCTLVNAINNANSDADTDGAHGCSVGSGADTIELPANAIFVLTSANNTTDAPNGLPVISSAMTINGNNATIERPSSVSLPGFRLLSVNSTGNLTVNNLTLKGGADPVNFDKPGGINNKGVLTINHSRIFGNPDEMPFSPNSGGVANSGTMAMTDSVVSDSFTYLSGIVDNQGSMSLINSTVSDNFSYIGGAIRNQGSMSLTNSTVTNNGSTYIGGISNFGVMTLANSTVSDNSAFYYTGGISNSGDITIIDSRVTDNEAAFNGGINNTGVMRLNNTTVSGNSTFPFPSGLVFNAGGINNLGSLTLTNSTVSGNTSSEGPGGIHNIGIGVFGEPHNAQTTLINTTVSGNSSALGGFGGIYSDGSLTLINSLIANSLGGSDCAFLAGSPLNLQGVNLIKDSTCNAPLSGDPKLGLLLDNGGPTFTHSLKTASPALNKATGALCPSTDQRGIKRPRPSSNTCDIGSFEKLKKQTIPANVQTVVQFFDTEATAARIKGIGSGDEAIQLRDAVRNQLVAAGMYTTASQACSQLTRTLDRIDTDNIPDADDYVTGSSGDQLAVQVSDLQIAWSCL